MSVPIVSLAMPAQSAAFGINSPGNGSVFSSSRVGVSATADWGTWRLVVVSPSGGAQTLNTKTGVGGPISGTASARANGKYIAILQNHTIGWQDRDTRYFYVRIPPRSPSGVSGSVSGNTLRVSWRGGSESDVSYSVKASGIDSKSGSKGTFCSGSSCSTSFGLSSSDTGTTTVSVRASRPDGSGGTVSSGYGSDSVALGRGSGGRSGGNGDGGSTRINPPNYNTGNNNQTPLTPFNEDSPVTLPSVQPDGAQPGFAYQAPVVAGGQKPNARNVAATDSLQWGKSVAIALVLLIIAAHLGTWTRRLRIAQAGVSSLGMAARAARSGSGRDRVRRMRDHIARAEASAKTSTHPKPRQGAKGARSGDTAVMPVPGAKRQSKKAKTTKFGGLIATEPKKGKGPAPKSAPPGAPGTNEPRPNPDPGPSSGPQGAPGAHDPRPSHGPGMTGGPTGAAGANQPSHGPGVAGPSNRQPGIGPQPPGSQRERIEGYEIISSDPAASPGRPPTGPTADPGADSQPNRKGKHAFRKRRRDK